MCCGEGDRKSSITASSSNTRPETIPDLGSRHYETSCDTARKPIYNCFSRFPNQMATRVSSTRSKSIRITKLLAEEVVPMFGVPEALLSDRGTNLLLHLMKKVCELLAITNLNTTVYHPACNSMVE